MFLSSKQIVRHFCLQNVRDKFTTVQQMADVSHFISLVQNVCPALNHEQRSVTWLEPRNTALPIYMASDD